MDNNFSVSFAPHILGNVKTSNIMAHVVISLIPAMAMSIYIFGLSAAILILTTVVSCVGFEYLYNLLMKQDQTINDCSAIITGILLAFNLPATLPLWMAIIGAFVAIVVVKMLFGGLGKNFANPAIVGRIVLFCSFSKAMTDYPSAFYYRSSEIVSSATHLTSLNNAWLKDVYIKKPDVMDMFLGFEGGVLGETSAFALLIGAGYLVFKKILNPIIPIFYLSTVYIFATYLNAYPLHQILGGGVMLAALYMATDYVTSPLSNKGKMVFGIGCGIITVAIRLYGGYPEGASFAILLMNIVVPYIEKFTINRTLGGAKYVDKQK